MLDFEKELEKFEPSMEVDEVEDVIRSKDVSDITDLMREILTDSKKGKNN